MVLNIVFFNRIVNEWNSLPNHIREANCIETFKRNVLSYLMDKQNICIFVFVFVSCTVYLFII